MYFIHKATFFQGSGTLYYAKIGCQKSLSTEAAEVARGKCGTGGTVQCSGGFQGRGGGGGVGGGSLKVCSGTLYYAKIVCQKSLSTEAAEVAQANAVPNGTFGTYCTMFRGKATFFLRGGGGGGRGGLSKYAQVHYIMRKLGVKTR